MGAPTASDLVHAKAMADWRVEINLMTVQERKETEGEACSCAIRYTRLAAYTAARRAGHNHRGAVEASNKASAAVREALGFSNAEDDITF